MGEVIDLISKQPHMSGTVRCLSCKREWVGVSPLGVSGGLECPECGLFKGAHIGLAAPESRWICNCENELFYISETNNIICAYCGQVQEFD